MALYLLIPLAGALGALCRLTCVRALTALGTGAPWGTLAVNLIGSFLAGLLYAPLRAHHPLLAQVLFLGFLGAFCILQSRLRRVEVFLRQRPPEVIRGLRFC